MVNEIKFIKKMYLKEKKCFKNEHLKKAPKFVLSEFECM